MTTTRSQRLDALRRKTRTQVLVIGGGINGISTWRELVLNGVDVILVDQGDFMSGASSAPSRMIHGGLRYMENGEFALVRESLRERNLLLRNAPHLVSPLPTLIPLTSRFSGIWSAARRFFGANVAPGDRGALIVRLGLSLYDLYAGTASGLPRHRFFGKGQTRKLWPELRGDVIGSAIYYDAKISHPERLGIEMILECDGLANSLALNHLAFMKLTQEGAVLEDRLTGERFELEADIVVNASGAWIDLTNGALAGSPPRLIGGTKGSHIVIANDRLKQALGDNMVYFANREGRVCILFAHLGNVLAGSTDISVDTPDGVHCEPREVDYILSSIGEVFPNIAIRPEEIIYRFAGVRPLPSSDGDVNANISRDHSCEWLPAPAGAARPVLNLVGGKWTTFRAFGEEAADKVMAQLGTSRSVETSVRPIGGGRDLPAASPPSFLQSLPHHTREEIEWLIAEQHVATLADLVLRRLTIAFSGELSLATIEELGFIAAAALGWDEARLQRETARLLNLLDQFHGLSEATLRSRNPEVDDVRRPQSAHEPPVRKRQMS
jgi:glycerol-3-phosphate dehydrogenase